jgi:uncharacterized protein YrrD
VADPVSWKVVEPGWEVAASDGDSVGTVHEVLGDAEADIFSGLAVSEGLLSKTRFVPSEHVARIEAGVVHLTLDAAAFSQLDET